MKNPRKPPRKKAASASGNVAMGRAMRLHQAGRLDESLVEYARVLAAEPANADACNNMGVALRALGRLEAAVASYKRAVDLTPDNAGLHSNLGNALRALDRFDEALAHQKRAVKLSPQSAEANYNMGLVYRDTARVDQAIECFDKALAIKDDYKDCRWDRSLLLLQRGDFEQGFAEYEWRWSLERSPPRSCPQPLWDGTPLAGRTLLIHQEQGFGDIIQFARYIPLIKALDGTPPHVPPGKGASRVILECQAELHRLFSSMTEIDALVKRQDAPPSFDVYAPMLSLPRIMGTRLNTIPAEVPYLKAPKYKTPALPVPAETKLKVGISWAGKPTHTNDRNRSCTLARFMDLAALPGVALYSLQKGEAAAELASHGCPALVTDVGSHMRDFADTARVLEQLDLVITVDTAVAHLAGALGMAVWVVLPYAVDWRWLQKREDSPWYPTMKLFRQPDLKPGGDWDAVFSSLEKALRAELENR